MATHCMHFLLFYINSIKRTMILQLNGYIVLLYNFILKVIMTQNCIYNLFLANIELYFEKKLCLGRFIMSARKNGLKTYFNILFVNLKIY